MGSGNVMGPCEKNSYINGSPIAYLTLVALLSVSACFLPVLLPRQTALAAGCGEHECSVSGATEMLNLVTQTYFYGDIPFEARNSLDRLVGHAVEKMAERGFTEETFNLAAENLRRILDNTPSGAEDMLPRQLERVERGTLALCPLWPFC